MIDATITNTDALDAKMPPDPKSLTYSHVLSRRLKEKRKLKAKEEANVVGDVSSNSVSRQHDPEIPDDARKSTFREVVDDFAQQHDFSLQPRVGANAMKDGNQVFNFGRVPVYLDSDVAFALVGAKWEATSLEELVRLNK